MSVPNYEEAIQRLMQQAEIGGWYKEDSAVPVRIGDLYSTFDELKRLQGELKSAKQLLLNAVNPLASKMTAQELHTEILKFLQENK